MFDEHSGQLNDEIEIIWELELLIDEVLAYKKLKQARSIGKIKYI